MLVLAICVNKVARPPATWQSLVFYLFNNFFSWGRLTTPWLYAPEVCALRIRQKGAAAASVAFWICNFIGRCRNYAYCHPRNQYEDLSPVLRYHRRHCPYRLLLLRKLARDVECAEVTNAYKFTGGDHQHAPRVRRPPPRDRRMDQGRS